MSFQVGDRVKYIRTGRHLYGEEGIISEIRSSVCVVEFDEGSVVNCSNDSLELIPGLFKGQQSELPLIPRKTCDCGGYKVYGSMESPMHSSWCESLK